MNPGAFEGFLRRALEEDAPFGDKTSEAVGIQGVGTGFLLAKQEMVVCGVPACLRAFTLADASCVGTALAEEGSLVRPGELLGKVEGPLAALLFAERTALNLLQRLCGIATLSRRAAEAVAGTACRIVDTRKTSPGMRLLEKYAVRTGGAFNHRMGLSDGVLIKDNHIAAVGSVGEAVRRAKASSGHLWKIEVEVKSIAEFREALAAGAEVVLLDNMSEEQMAACVAERPAGILLEASGNMTISRLPAVAALGVDLISMGALTHSAKASDISFEIEAARR